MEDFQRGLPLERHYCDLRNLGYGTCALCISDVDPGLINVGFLVRNANYRKFNVKLLLFIADLYIYFLRVVF